MRFFLRSLFLTLSVSFTTSVFATDYVFSGNGDWNNPDNWVGGIVPPEELPEGSTITILGTTALGLPCAPNEECEGSDPMWRNEGTIIISPGGTLTLQNYTQFSHKGSIIVNGTLINKTTLEVYEGSNIEINGILRNESWIGNQGLITINSGGVVENLSGTFDNNFINLGKIVLHAGGIISNLPPAILVLGDIINNGGAINNASTLSGECTLTGNLNNAGILAPGNSPGTYTINGNYTAGSSALHTFEIAGTVDGTFDVLKVSGIVTLNGRLNITLIDGFEQSSAHEIPIISGTISGTFSSVDLPEQYVLVYNSQNVLLRKTNIQLAEIVNFTTEKEDQTVALRWEVQNGQNVLSYEVERSEDGHTFSKIASLDASGQTTYNTTDANPTDANHYRIKIVHTEGLQKYSSIQTVYFNLNLNVFTGSGNWSDASRWSKGVAPSSLSAGEKAVINGVCDFNLVNFQNNGEIEIATNGTVNLNNGTLSNTGTLNVYGTLNIKANITALGIINIKGTLTNFAIFKNNSTSFSLQNGSRFHNAVTGVFEAGTVNVHQNANFINNGFLKGAINFKGNLVNVGTIAPGDYKTVTIDGNYEATASSTHSFKLGGFGDAYHDAIKASGNVHLAGTLRVTLENGFAPTTQQDLPIVTGTISGTFSTVDLPARYTIVYTNKAVLLRSIPVQLVKIENFSVKQEGETAAKLTWGVQNQQDVLRYDIERGSDNFSYTKIGSIDARLDLREYNFIDPSPNDINYYVIKAIHVEELNTSTDWEEFYFKPDINVFTGPGNWEDGSRWSKGSAPFDLWDGQKAVINGICNFNTSFDFMAGGLIEVSENSVLNLNGGTLLHYGILIVKGELNNNNSFIDGYGKVKITGTFNNNAAIRQTSPFFFLTTGSNFENKSSGVIDIGYVKISDEATFINEGRINGYTIFEGNVSNTGILSPGNSPGTCVITGNYIASTSAVHTFEIGGTTNGSYDVLSVSGDVNLNGVLDVSVINGFHSTAPHDIPIITGTINGAFSSVILPAGYTIAYESNQIVLRKLVTVPVTFISFAGWRESGQVRLRWKVGEELNVAQYEIEKSSQQGTFDRIGLVASGNTEYYFIDAQPQEESFYRIKGVDYDGSYKYSSIISVKGKSSFNVFPSPARDELYVQHEMAPRGSIIRIISVDGKLAKLANVKAGSQQTSMSLAELRPGIYFVQFNNGLGKTGTIKITKQ